MINNPRKPYYFIFAGFLFIIMGWTRGGMIPSEVKILSGILAIAYGGYLLYKKKNIEN